VKKQRLEEFEQKDSSNEAERAPSKQADFLLKEAEAVRAEIVYKMQIAHRISLTILVAPNVVLPGMAKLAHQVVSTSPDQNLGRETALFNVALVVVAACLPLLLLWADLFCHSQVNGIRRAGDWMRNLEQSFGLGSTRDGWSGWESWISSSRRRLWDDDLYRWLREALVFLYYTASAGMAAFLVGQMLQDSDALTLIAIPTDHAKIASYAVLGLVFALIYAALMGLRVATTYTDENVLSHENLMRVEPEIIRAAALAYRQDSVALKFPYVVASIAPADDAPADPFRLRGESSRVLGSYQELYDWDGIFCGGALIHEQAPLNTVLEGVIRNFLAAQLPDGFVPKSLTKDGEQLDPHEACKPLLAQAALTVSRARGGHGWLDDAVFDGLVNFVEYWLRERRGPSGMFKWRSSLESGVDNNASLVQFPPFSIESVDATCFFIRECAALAVLAEDRGKAPLADRLRRWARDAQQALLSKSWDEDAGFFWNRDIQSGLPVKLMSWTGLMPLWGGFPPSKVRSQIVKWHLRPGEACLSTYGVLTLARREVAFNNCRRTYIWDHTAQKRKEVSNWQGPTWVLPNALVADALATYGYRSLAQLICRGTLMLLARDLQQSGTMHECYDADTGAPLWASGFLSWNALGLGMWRWLERRSPTILPDGLSTASVTLS
jgi:hypothetical protein